MDNQKTINVPISAVDYRQSERSPARMSLYPAASGHGLVFRFRTRSGRSIDVPASVEFAHVFDGHLTLCRGRTQIKGVAPLLAACCGLGIDNLLIEINRGTLPQLKGGAAGFVFLLQAAGISELSERRATLALPTAVGARLHASWMRALPNNVGLRVEWSGVERGADEGMIYCFDGAVDISPGVFSSEICYGRLPGDEDTLPKNSTAAQRRREQLARNHSILEVLAMMALLPGRLMATIVTFHPSCPLIYRLLKRMGFVSNPLSSSEMVIEP